MELRIGVNAGGSFTDFLVVDEAGNAETYKTSTTLEDPSIGFFRGLEKAAYQRGLQLDAFLQVIAFESGVTKTVDPLGGSYYVENLANTGEAR